MTALSSEEQIPTVKDKSFLVHLVNNGDMKAGQWWSRHDLTERYVQMFKSDMFIMGANGPTCYSTVIWVYTGWFICGCSYSICPAGGSLVSLQTGLYEHLRVITLCHIFRWQNWSVIIFINAFLFTLGLCFRITIRTGAAENDYDYKLDLLSQRLCCFLVRFPAAFRLQDPGQLNWSQSCSGSGI